MSDISEEYISNEEQPLDPFDASNAPGLSLVMQFRIYDALMTLIRLQDEEASNRLLEIHAKGAVLGASPEFSGTFLTNVINPDGFDIEDSENDARPSDASHEYE